ncbi:MAG: RNA-binding S4 domain-containing protein [Firmicutes bacterium]|nr:RNA-binding S4 domain-containing protein [Bacillota bacterium]
MRLDLFLKVSRLVKRRTVAKEACDNGKVEVNGRPGKASSEVKPGDVITLDYGPRLLTVEVLAVPEGLPPKTAAQELYRVVSDDRRRERV